MARPPLAPSISSHQSDPFIRPPSSQSDSAAGSRPNSASKTSPWKSNPLSRAAGALLMKAQQQALGLVGDSNAGQSAGETLESLIQERDQLKQELERTRSDQQALVRKYQFQIERLKKDCQEAETEAAEARMELAATRQEFQNFQKRIANESEARKKLCPADSVNAPGDEIKVAVNVRKRNEAFDRKLNQMEDIMRRIETAFGIEVPEVESDDCIRDETLSVKDQPLEEIENFRPVKEILTQSGAETKSISDQGSVSEKFDGCKDSKNMNNQIASIDEFQEPDLTVISEESPHPYRRVESLLFGKENDPLTPLKEDLQLQNFVTTPVISERNDDEWKNSFLDILKKLDQ